MAGLAAESHDFGVTTPKTTANEGAGLIRKLADLEALTSADVAEFIQNIGAGKFASFVPEVMARGQWARQNAAIVKQIPSMASSVVASRNIKPGEGGGGAS
jgi:hypothetical protein